MFRDEARVRVRGGRGGDGIIAFHREKFIPKGGPSGGDGGHGGSVFLEASPQVHTLWEIGRRPIFHAPHGAPGSGGNRRGGNGEDLVLDVPVGTVVRDAARGHVLRDLTSPGDRICVAKGGRGGRGNRAFASATRQVPRVREEGTPGEERELLLELRLMADVGLVGLPNAGKSTFLSRVSAARPKVAAYPFTTLEPVLGVVALPGWREVVLADLPGLIEGASRGAGLGHRFLRHARRTRVLLHLVAARPPAAPSPGEAWRVVRAELAAYDRNLAARPEVVVLTKCDLTGWEADREELEGACGSRVYPVSAVAGRGLREALAAAVRLLENGGGGPRGPRRRGAAKGR